MESNKGGKGEETTSTKDGFDDGKHGKVMPMAWWWVMGELLGMGMEHTCIRRVYMGRGPGGLWLHGPRDLVWLGISINMHGCNELGHTGSSYTSYDIWCHQF